MKPRLFSGLSLLVLFMVGCAHETPTAPKSVVSRLPHSTSLPDIPKHRVPKEETFGDPPGSYSSSVLRGEYAGYPALEHFIDKLVTERGFTRSYLYGLFSQAHRKEWTLDYLQHEPKPSAVPRPGAWSRYRAKFLTELHISSGASFWARHHSALKRAHAEYGVTPEHIMGIIGVETLYGRNVGNHRILDALTTLAMDYPRRASYFTEELENFLVMAQKEHFDPSRPVGSYAGAMGLGQFMPSSFLKFAVDFNGDGQKDLWDPEDAIGSVAHYFSSHGWRAGEPVVSRAVVDHPTSVENLQYGLDSHYSLEALSGYGIHPTSPFPVESVRLLRLTALEGDEYWIGYDNFYVITRYNHSTHYAMAVHQLASAIKRRYQGS